MTLYSLTSNGVIMTQQEFFKYLNSGVTTLGIFNYSNMLFTKECEVLDKDMYLIYRFNPSLNQWVLTYSLNINQLDEAA